MWGLAQTTAWTQPNSPHRPPRQAHSLPTELQTTLSTEVHPALRAPRRESWAPAILRGSLVFGRLLLLGPLLRVFDISGSSAYINTFFKPFLRGDHNLCLLFSLRERFGEER